MLRIPVDIDGSYVFRTELTRETGNETIGVSLPVAGHRCLFALSAYAGGAGGLMLVDGRELRDTNNPTRVAPNALTNGQRYAVEIAVTVKGDQVVIGASVGGKPFCRWQGASSSLTVYRDHDVFAPKQIGLYSRTARTLFHNASLTPRGGTATPAADAARLATVAKPRRLPTNLLELVDVEAHKVNQTWTRDGTNVVSPNAYAALLKIPVTIAGGYDAKLEFTRIEGHELVGLVLPVGDHYCDVLMSIGGGELGGISQIQGKGLEEGPASVRPSPLSNNERHTLRVRVVIQNEDVAIDTALDGKPFARWSGVISDLSVGDVRRLPQPGHFGLYAHEATVEFHSLRLTTLGGKATADADAILPKSARPTPVALSVDVSSGLIAHWTFDEGEGAVARDSRGGHDGEIRGATWTRGVHGGALSFDGKASAVAIGNHGDLRFAGPITLAAWVKIKGLPAMATISNIVGHAVADEREAYLRLLGTDPYSIQVGGKSDAGENQVPIPLIKIDMQGWVHLAGVYDGKAWRLYRNGRLVASADSTPEKATFGGDWAIGAHVPQNIKFFHGDIDEVRIYNRGLSADDVRSLYLGRASTATSVPR